MQTWWETLSLFEKILWLIAIPFSVLFFIQMVLTFFGFSGSTDPGADLPSDIPHDADAHLPNDSSVDAGPTFSFFTIRNFVAFFTVFGWAGLACHHSGLSQLVSIVLALVLGIAAMFLVSGLFYFTMKLADSGNMNINNALNQTGKVYLPIKANQANTGKVHITVQGSLRELPAITKGNADLPTGTLVKVTGIAADNILIVENAG